MKTYPTLRLDWPHSKGIYERTHHKRIEFWHKTNYLYGLVVESVEIKKNNQPLIDQGIKFINIKDLQNDELKYE